MTRDKSENTNRRVNCSEIVYRAARKSSWVNEEERRLEPAAYELRPATKDRAAERGISLGLASHCTAEAYTDPRVCQLKKVHAVATHHVGRIHGLELSVIQDKPDHAEIIGLFGLDEDRAYDLSVRLSEQSRIAWPETLKWAARQS